MKILFFLLSILTTSVSYNLYPRDWSTDTLQYDVYMKGSDTAEISQSQIINQIQIATNSWNLAAPPGTPVLEFSDLIYGTDCPPIPEKEGQLCFRSDMIFPAMTTMDIDRLGDKFNINFDVSALRTRAMAYNVILHELGHVLLLEHSELSDIMGNSLTRAQGEYVKVYDVININGDDLAGLQAKFAPDFPMSVPIPIPPSASTAVVANPGIPIRHQIPVPNSPIPSPNSPIPGKPVKIPVPQKPEQKKCTCTCIIEG